MATNGNEFSLGDEVEGLLGGGGHGRVGEVGEDVMDGVDRCDVCECGIGI